MTRPIHPFPARMAPELSGAMLAALPPNSRVLDPMCGSGTVIRQAVEAGHICVGRDIDPLAVLVTRAWVTPIDAYRLLHDAHDIVERARSLPRASVHPPWSDDETDRFARYWFAEQQLADLSALAYVLRSCRFRSRDVLRVCFSRLIITKDSGASLARDVSHSRPHKVRAQNDFDCFAGFLRAARLIAARHDPSRLRGTAVIELGDARDMVATDALFDAAVTSPPYLNAIDYMRGHRLTLIWFGHRLQDLQVIRAKSTGCERAVTTDNAPFDVLPFISNGRDVLAERYVGWIRRYAADASATLGALRGAVRSGGRVMLVIGNSLIRGTAVDNARIMIRAAECAGMELIDSVERDIPARRRYLPLPKNGSTLARRMRAESVLTFAVP